MDINYHKKWSQKYQIIRGVFTNPADIFDKLLELQKPYTFPLFSYKIINYDEFSFNYYDSLKNTELLLKERNFILKLNKYEQFCCLALYEFKLAYFLNEDFLDRFRSQTVEVVNFFYGESIFSIPGMDYYFANTIFDRPTKELNYFFMGLTLISVYFSKLPYLYGILNYEEILSILKEELTIEDLRKDYHEFLEKHLNILVNKIIEEKVSILEEIIPLKSMQTFLIKFVKLWAKITVKFEYDNYCKFPLMIKNLMDIDFCLKLFFVYIYALFESKQYRIKCTSAVNEVDKRIDSFQIYCSSKIYKEIALKHVSEEVLTTLNETLKIRDFIVIGNKKFHEMIKGLENNFAHKKIGYLNIQELREYLIKKKDTKYRNFTYFLIIKPKDAEKMYKELYSIKNEFALILYLIIYNKDTKLLINKRPFQIKSHFPLFIANNESELINIINSQEYIHCGFNFDNQASKIMKEIKDLIKENNLKIPKIDFKEEDKIERISSEDGWELVDKVPEKIFKDVILGMNGFTFITSNIKMNFFGIYKENTIDFLFNQTYCKFFGFILLPELMFVSINIMIKHFLYAYTLHEDKNSFYYLMNKDLRSGDYLKVKKYTEIISMINYAFKENDIKCYKGQVFRGTKMENKYIDEKIKVGNVLTNLSFWSASKNIEIAKKFLRGKNILFLIETKKNNVDIDLEQISKFNESEVLFLPFSKFLVRSKKKIIFEGKEIFEVILEGLDEEHERGNIKSIPLLNDMTHALLNK